MSNIRFQGNPSGTGTLTIASPNTNSDFTLNLPTANGTIPLLATVTNNGVMFIDNSGQPTSGSGLVFNSSGNLGLGVTPSAWSSSFKALNIGANGQSVSADGGQIIIGSNYVQESGGARYVASAAAGSYAISRNSHAWYVAPSGTAGNAISFTQAMTLDASGNLGIGTSSPGTRLDVSGNLRFSAVNPVIEFNNGGAQVYSTTANTLQFASGGGIGSPTERARIDSSGNLLVNTTTNTNNSRIVSNGVIESTSGGVRFPDGTTQTTAAGALTTTAVLNAIAGASLGAVGTYAFLAHASGSDVSPGATVAGSAMRYAGGISRLQYGSTNNIDSRSGSAPAGTWRCMGNSIAINVCSVVSLFGSVFLRIS